MSFPKHECKIYTYFDHMLTQIGNKYWVYWEDQYKILRISDREDCAEWEVPVTTTYLFGRILDETKKIITEVVIFKKLMDYMKNLNTVQFLGEVDDVTKRIVQKRKLVANF